MAYNYPMAYQPYMPQYQQNNGIIWIQGEQAAKSYLTAPNTTVPLWDSEAQRIYLKSTDASGMPSIKILEYTVLDAQKAQKQVLSPLDDKDIEYATKTDLRGIYDRLDALERGKDESDISGNARLNRSEVQPVPSKLHRKPTAGGSGNAKHWKDNTEPV